MMKEEFEKLLGRSVNDAEYEIIETVYMFHPSNPSKDDIVRIYEIGGMSIIRDMEPRAMRAMNILDEIKTLKAEIVKLEDKYEELTKGEIR